MCALDGYDAMLAGSAARLRQAYERVVARAGGGGGGGGGASIVFSADQTFFFAGMAGELEYGARYPRAPTAYRFLNSGSLVGPAPELLRLVDAVVGRYVHCDGCAWDRVSDQTLFHRHLVDATTDAAGRLSGPPIALDHFQELFGNTGGREYKADFGVLGGRLHNRHTDTFPAVLHCPGKPRFQAEFDRLADAGWDTPVLSCAGGG